MRSREAYIKDEKIPIRYLTAAPGIMLSSSPMARRQARDLSKAYSRCSARGPYALATSFCAVGYAMGRRGFITATAHAGGRVCGASSSEARLRIDPAPRWRWRAPMTNNMCAWPIVSGRFPRPVVVTAPCDSVVQGVRGSSLEPQRRRNLRANQELTCSATRLSCSEHAGTEIRDLPDHINIARSQRRLAFWGKWRFLLLCQ